MKNLTLSVVLALAPFTAQAGATAESNSQSAANSQVILEGSEYGHNTPGLGGVSGNNTAPCVISQGIGLVGPGGGIQFGNGRIDPDCLTRTEAAMVLDLLNKPPSLGKRAAITHACTHSKRLQQTLVAVGVCVVQTR